MLVFAVELSVSSSYLPVRIFLASRNLDCSSGLCIKPMHNDEQAIRNVIEKWLRASATGDVNTMLTLLADDMVFIVPGQPPFGKQEFKAAWDGPMKGAKIAADAVVEEVLISGDFGCTRT